MKRVIYEYRYSIISNIYIHTHTHTHTHTHMVVLWFDLLGFILARQILYHLIFTPIPFCFSYFLDRVIFAPGLNSTCTFWATYIFTGGPGGYI
jgi:hypothetical protein